MKLKLLLAVIIALLSLNITYAQNLSFEGNKVFINDSNVYMSQTPHTIYSNKGVFENVLISKTFSGAVDIAFGFNSDNMKPKNVYLYKPHTILREESFTCDEPYFYNYTTKPLTIYCWYNHTDINFTELVMSRTDITHYDLTGKTFFWNIEDKYDYKKVNDIFTRQKFNHNNKNIWYYAKGLNITANTEYKLKVQADITPYTSGKYDFCVKPTSQSFSVAKMLGNIYCLDPYFNTTCTYTSGSDWTITDGTSCKITQNISMGNYILNITNGSVLISNNSVLKNKGVMIHKNNGLLAINKSGSAYQMNITEDTIFNPLHIDNITLWLDATNYSALVTSLGGIGTWKDQSGNGYDFTQGTYAYQPSNTTHTINGLPVLYFNDDWIFRTDVMGLTGNPAITLFYVRKYYDLSSEHWDFYLGTFLTTNLREAIFFGALASDNRNSFRFNGGNEVFDVTDTSEIISVYVRGDGDDLEGGEYYNSGSEQTQFSSANPTLTINITNIRSIIGSRVFSSTGSIQISGMSDTDIGEIIIYNRNLTKSELNQVGDYLSNKWGINWTTIT